MMSHHYYMTCRSCSNTVLLIWEQVTPVIQYFITIPYIWRRQWHPTLVLLPGKSQGWGSLVGCRLWGSLVGCSPCGRGESDTTEWLPFHFSLSCIGEGNGNPLQCSCLENPRDGGASWAAVYGVTQSRTQLKRLSSSSSSSSIAAPLPLPHPIYIVEKAKQEWQSLITIFSF